MNSNQEAQSASADVRALNVRREAEALYDRLSAETDAHLAVGCNEAAKETWLRSVAIMEGLCDDSIPALAAILDAEERA